MYAIDVSFTDNDDDAIISYYYYYYHFNDAEGLLCIERACLMVTGLCVCMSCVGNTKNAI